MEKDLIIPADETDEKMLPNVECDLASDSTNDWNWNEDKANPYNWPIRLKVQQVLMIALAALTT